ncbi:MAG: hypothetical protein H6873_05390 [Hyphomicrobiaceae bacterium]|nr:hypothetical protein [Hyphomicrobiaceae bacterium]
MAARFSLRDLFLLHVAAWLPLGIAALWGVSGGTGADDFSFNYGVALLYLAAGTRFGMHYGRFNALNWHQKLVVFVPLIGILAMLVSGDARLGLLIAGFAAQGAIDAWGGYAGVVPDRYVQARLFGTGLIVATLIVVILFG